MVEESPPACDRCQGAHPTSQCSMMNSMGELTIEQAQICQSFLLIKTSTYAQSYNPGWKNHPNFSWKNQNAVNPMEQMKPTPPPEQKKSSLDQKLEQLGDMQIIMLQSQNKFENETRTSLNNQAAQLKNLEVQMGQMATLFSERQQGNLPSTSEVNPRREGKERCKAITLRSGKTLEKSAENHEDAENSVGGEKNSAENVEKAEKLLKNSAPSTPKKVEVKESSVEEKPIVPYPQRLRKNRVDNQFGKFMEIYKKLHINIPFVEELEQMSGYVKFMKDILSKKRKLGDYETVTLSKECSAILQKKLPPKLKDPSSFTIPCAIGNSVFEKALCDLGASIDLMPLSIFKKLKLGEAQPTTITLQLADQSHTRPRGIIEDVLVKVDKFIFPADFIILDMEEDKEVPIILGRPFLDKGRALIDVQKGELKLKV